MKIKRYIKALRGVSSETILALVATALIAPVPVLWTVNSTGWLENPDVSILHVSPPGSPYAGNKYSDIEVALDNQGTATAQGCFVRVSGSPPASEDPADFEILAESERFDLSPQDGRVVTLSLYLPDANGKRVAFGAACQNIGLSEPA